MLSCCPGQEDEDPLEAMAKRKAERLAKGKEQPEPDPSAEEVNNSLCCVCCLT